MELLNSKIIRKWSKITLPVIIGAAGGYLYYHYVGCVSGTCPITGNPWLSTAYGAFAGSLFISIKSKKAKSDN